jgi:hypothetical protein
MGEQVTEADVIVSGVPPRMLDKYTCRFKKAEFKPSNSGNPMVTVESEIVRPATKTIGGKTYALDSLTIRDYFPITVLENGKVDEEKTKKARGRYLQFRKAIGLNPSFDPDAPGEKDIENVVVDRILDSKEEHHMRQKDDGSGLEPIIDEATKQPLSKGWSIVPKEIIGRSSVEVNRPY